MEPLRQAELARLIARPFAHRGLHGKGRIENSRAAFEAAIAAGHGIELDVRISGDGQAVVFHDDELGRLTQRHGPVNAHSLAELQRIRLNDSEETIPSLGEVLALIAGRVPLLIELKAPEREVGTLSRSVDQALGSYLGAVAVMSFNPEVGRWFARNAPKWLRGLVVTEAGRRWRGGIERQLSLWRARPDFLAYDIRDLPSRFAESARARGVPILTWTCRSLEDRARAAEHANQIIYEVPE